MTPSANVPNEPFGEIETDKTRCSCNQNQRIEKEKSGSEHAYQFEFMIDSSSTACFRRAFNELITLN